MSDPTVGDWPHIWRTTLAALDEQGLPDRARALLKMARLVGVLDHTALLQVPNDYVKRVAENDHRDVILAALGSVLVSPVRLAVSVDPALGGYGDALDPADAAGGGLAESADREDDTDAAPSPEVAASRASVTAGDSARPRVWK